MNFESVFLLAPVLGGMFVQTLFIARINEVRITAVLERVKLNEKSIDTLAARVDKVQIHPL